MDWIEYVNADDGRKYYHNRKTNTSVWNKPDEMIQFENSNRKQNIPPNNSMVVQQNQPSSVWREYVASDGRKYYHNTKTDTTSWDPPPEFQQQAAHHNNLRNSPTSNQTNTPPQQHHHAMSNQQKTKDDHIKAFIDMLKEHDIGTTWTFDRAFRLIANDERYQALKTMTERKQLFQDYINDKKRTEYEEKKKREKRNRDDYIQLLKETKEITTSTTWRHISLLLDGNPRFESLDSEREREDIFKSYLDELEQLEKDQILSKKQDSMKQFKQRLESNSQITYTTQWRKVRDEYEQDPLVLSGELDKFDVLSIFEAHIRELEKKNDDIKRSERDQLKRESRKDRDAFREFLIQKYQSNDLHALTRWKEFKEKFQSSPEFQKIANQTIGSSPLELFTDYKEELEIKYERDYKKLKDIVKDVNYIYQPGISNLESFKESILKHEKINSVSHSNFIPFLEYLRYKEESKEKSLAKKKKKLIHNFKQLLVDQKSITKDSTWSLTKPTLEKEKEFQALADDEAELEKHFDLYIKFLIEKDQEKQAQQAQLQEKQAQQAQQLEENMDGEEGELIDTTPMNTSSGSIDLKKKRTNQEMNAHHIGQHPSVGMGGFIIDPHHPHQLLSPNHYHHGPDDFYESDYNRNIYDYRNEYSHFTSSNSRDFRSSEIDDRPFKKEKRRP